MKNTRNRGQVTLSKNVNICIYFLIVRIFINYRFNQNLSLKGSFILIVVNYFKHPIINMLLKIVLNNQIRLFDCKETLTLEGLHDFIKKAFPHLANYSLYYFDDENDQIILETKEDVGVYLQGFNKKPKIHIRKIEPEGAAFDKTVQLLAEEIKPMPQQKREQKVQQAKKQAELPHEQKPRQLNPSLEKQQMKEEVTQEKQKNNYILHEVECCKCLESPIKNIRYRCARCQHLNLCQLCFEQTTHKELHPFVKIRDPSSAPIEVGLKIQEPPSQKIQLKKPEKLMKQQKEQELKYESESERRQLIISFLQNLFGQENYESYCEFAKVSSDSTFSKVCESYLSWMVARNEPNGLKQLVGWIGDKISKQFDKWIHFHND